MKVFKIKRDSVGLDKATCNFKRIPMAMTVAVAVVVAVAVAVVVAVAGPWP